MPPIRPLLTRPLLRSPFPRPQWRNPHISWQSRRFEQTIAVNPPLAPSPKPPRKRRSVKTLAVIYFLTFGTVGLAVGYVMQATFIPPKAPPAGSPEDDRMLAILAHDIDNLHLVRTLRRSSRRLGEEDEEIESMHKDLPTLHNAISVDRLVRRENLPAGSQPLGSVPPPSPGFEEARGWIEIPVQEPRKNNLTALMQGTGGFGVQRAFWSPAGNELVMIVWFGAGLCGWPGLAHGGAIATLLCEGTRMAAECVSGKTFAAAPSLEAHPYNPAMLSLTYVRPTNINNFYVFRARLTSSPDAEQVPPVETRLSSRKDMTKKHGLQEKAKSLLWQKPIEIDGSLETMEGKICVKVKTSWNL